MAQKSIETYGLYNPIIKVVPAPGNMCIRQPWWGGSQMPSNKSSGTPTKFKKVPITSNAQRNPGMGSGYGW